MSSEEQLSREHQQREAALGRRARGILSGDFGPVLRRWVSGSVAPIQARVEGAISAILSGDTDDLEALLASPVFGLPQWAADKRSPILHILRWTQRDPERLADFVLGVMGIVVSRLATSKERYAPFTSLILAAGRTCRETAIGQFVTQIQGAKAMQKVRKKTNAAWMQTAILGDVANLLGGQVRAAVESEPLEVDGRRVVQVVTPKGHTRRIDLKPPSAADWKLLEVARAVPGEKDLYDATWGSFAMLILCAAQAEAGWFDLVAQNRAESGATRLPRRDKRKRVSKSASHVLVLSDAAHEAIKQDLDKWLSLGFSYEPMVVEPQQGDYLSVKHRAVTGSRGPMGIKTRADQSAAWHVASEVMAKTQWSVPEGTLRAIRDSEFVQSLVDKKHPDELRRETLLNSYRKLATSPIYFPLFMDFRGRVYLRPSEVTYQGSDLQKALLCFPSNDAYRGEQEVPSSSVVRTVVMHMSNLYGKPLDKANFADRLEWYRSGIVQNAMFDAAAGNWDGRYAQDLLSQAEEPLQLLTCLWLSRSPSQVLRMACHIDGTCNGLQHLSALFRDETAAPWVNLTAGEPGGAPRDIYGAVASRVVELLNDIPDAWARRIQAAVRIDRKLCKKPVMVLPYGGTKMTIEDAVFESILDQEPDARYWTDGDPRHEPGSPPLYNDWIVGGYEAFRDRALKDHPLLHLDAHRLGALVWDAIVEILPKPIAAMEAFRKIARTVGDRPLRWSTGFTVPGTYDTIQARPPLEVIQAKAKSRSKALSMQGLHLPGSIRGLKIREGSDEIDPGAHVTGIVANFVHSCDAQHLARTMDQFGLREFGAIHDCFITRPNHMKSLGRSAREAWVRQYSNEGHPLRQPVWVGTEYYADWDHLAEACGVSFPAWGTWEPTEVLDSQWFFS